jgi:hypothetical protein
MQTSTQTEHDRWLLSFYRSSEINGALFFGRLARKRCGAARCRRT